MWVKVLHHVTNRHTWVPDENGYTTGRCSHDIPMDSETRTWIEVDSTAHNELIKIVYDKKLINSIEYVKNFR